MATSLSKLYGVFVDDANKSVLQMVQADDEPIIDPTGRQGGPFARLNTQSGELVWIRPRSQDAAGEAVNVSSCRASSLFDLVIDHRVGKRTTDWEFQLRPGVRQSLIKKVLRTGGVHACTLSNRFELRLLMPALMRSRVSRWLRRPPAWKMQLDLAESAGMQVCGSFFLYPSASNPNLMLATNERNCHEFFSSSLASNKARHSLLGYALRDAMLRARLYRWRMDSVLVWMQK